jgi:hypothetical protein
MSRFVLALFAAVALLVAAGACGSTITVPDQGIIVNGCQQPAQCFSMNCECTRAAISTSSCVVACQETVAGDPSTCDCLPIQTDGGPAIQTQCLETAMACIGRGVVCGGPNAHCKPPGSTCDGTGDLPQLIPVFGMPMLEPHCQYVDDVCCTSGDGGVPMTD